MRIYMPRFYTREPAANIARLRADCAEAAASGCAMAIFPEVFMSGYHLPVAAEELRTLFAELSAEHNGVLFFFGSISEDGVNRMPAYLNGQSVAEYDKVHLFLPGGEGELWRPGTRYVALRHGDWRIGMLVCNDIRFAEQALALSQAFSVNMLVVPALWPWQRDHVWASLLRARAIEHNCFAFGCCVAGVDNGHELFDGAGNHVFDPLGNEIHPQGRVYEIDHGVFERITVGTRAQHIAISEQQMFDSGRASEA